MKVRYTIRAERHLKAIAEHIAQDSPAAAGKVVSGIKASVERLERFPESGRVGGQGAWQLPVPRLPYVVIYRIRFEHVDILGVFHTSRDPSVRNRP